MTDPLYPRPIAHRGLHDRAAGVIENSASAFEAAIQRDFAIECDVQLTSDGVPVIFHDSDMEHLLGKPGRVLDIAAAEITAMPLLDSASGDKPQLFTEFLAQIDGRALLQIELKSPRDAAATQMLAFAAAAALRTYSGPVTVESFDPDLITLIRQFGFTGPRGIITYDYEPNEWEREMADDERFALKHLLHWHETRFDFISCNKNALELPAIKFWRALGKPVTVWTLASQDEVTAAAPHMDQIVFEGFDPDLAA